MAPPRREIQRGQFWRGQGVIDFDRALRPLRRKEPRMKTKTNVKAGIIVVC
jgi:hypothetical protein